MILNSVFMLYSEWQISELFSFCNVFCASDQPPLYVKISLISVSCKCFEKLINNVLQTYLQDNNLVTKDQHGLRQGLSVEDQLLLT